MSIKKKEFSFVILFLVAVLSGQSSITIPSSTSIDLPTGAYICAGSITVNGNFTYYSIGDVCVTPTVALSVIINEIHADPDAANGDANGDGSVNIDDDEFVEIVNRSGSSVDISNWVIADGYSNRHTVTNGTSIGDGEALVVFGGGTPTGISGIVQTASTGTLGLNNAGDDVILKDASGGIIASFTYGSEAGDNQSIARNPDYSGDFVKHLTISGNAVRFSPGRTNAGDVSLPVELTSFTADNSRAGEITLHWVTESEVENLGFILERRQASSGSSQAEWTEIASYIKDEALRGQGSVTYRTEYTFTDKTVEPGVTYDYRLADVSYAGEKVYHALNVLGVAVTEIPEEFALFPAYPNPFNPETVISYQLPVSSDVKLTIYDVSGRRVKQLVDGTIDPGLHTVEWNAKNIPSGVYFCKLTIGDRASTQKLILLK